MADIKQAAKWMDAGIATRRPQNGDSYYLGEGSIERVVHFYYADPKTPLECARRTRADMLSTEDLLADDWEIAE